MASTTVVDIAIDNTVDQAESAEKPSAAPNARTQATRYLSAAAYNNWRFRNRVIKEIVGANHKAVAPNYGVDLALVAKHCLRARRLKLFRDLLLLGLWIVPFASEGFIDDLIYVLEIPELLPQFPAFYGMPLLLIFGGAGVITLWEMWLAQHVTVAKRLSRDAFDASADKEDGAASQVRRQDGANVVIYGAFSPFVGSGLDLGGWSFSLNITKATDSLGGGGKPKPFNLRELYDHVTRHLHGLEIEELTIDDRLCVDGRTIRDDRRFLENSLARPVAAIAPELVEREMAEPAKNVRFYKMIQVVDWSGEIVVTIYLRFQKSDHTLFTEANYFLLPSFQEEHYRIDEQDPAFGLRKLMRYVATSAVMGPIHWLYAPVAAYIAAMRPISGFFEELRIRRQIKSNPAFNYGATASAREMATSGNYRAFFQKLDKEMHFKVVEQELLEGIISFLDERDIDTSSLSERQTTILNNGVIVTGGTVKAENLAVGARAKLFASRLTKSGAGTFKQPARHAG